MFKILDFIHQSIKIKYFVKKSKKKKFKIKAGSEKGSLTGSECRSVMTRMYVGSSSGSEKNHFGSATLGKTLLCKKISYLKDDILSQGGALHVGEHTYDYLTLVNWALLKLKYSGELARIQQKWWTPPASTACTV